VASALLDVFATSSDSLFGNGRTAMICIAGETSTNHESHRADRLSCESADKLISLSRDLSTGNEAGEMF
jgi:hypothetical protein